MAKSIRSKRMKAARSEQRRVVGKPHAKKLDAKCTKALAKSIKHKSGPGIDKLKSILKEARKRNPVVKEPPKNAFKFKHPTKGALQKQQKEEEESDDDESSEDEMDVAEGEGGEAGAAEDGKDADEKAGTKTETVRMNNMLFVEKAEVGTELSDRYLKKMNERERAAKKKNWVYFK